MTVTLNLLVEGGNAKPSPALSQQLGPLGVNLGKLIADVNKESAGFKGMKVPVVVEIDPGTRGYKLSVKTPPVAELLKKEISLEKGAGDAKLKVGNVAIEHIIKVAKAKEKDMLCKDFKACLRTVMGTCNSLGLLVEGKNSLEAVESLNKGEYDAIIKSGKTEVSSEKQKLLDKQFEKVREAIEKKRKEAEAKEEAEKKAAEKAAEAEAKPGEVEVEAKPGEVKPEAAAAGEAVVAGTKPGEAGETEEKTSSKQGEGQAGKKK